MTKPMSRAVQERRAPKTPAEAIAVGLRWYIPDEPCPKGHIAKRSVSNRECRRCVDDKRRLRRLANPATYRERDRSKYWKNPERERVLMKANRQKHVEKRRRAKRDAYHQAPDEYKRRAKAWGKEHPQYRRHQKAMRRAREIEAVPHWLTKQQRAEMRAIYVAARQIGPSVEVDHIVPLRGRLVCGLHVPWNLQILPMVANRQKSASHGS